MTRKRESTAQKTTPSIGDPMLKWLLVLVLLAPVIIGLLLSWHSLSGLDVWLHDRVGQDIISGEGFPHTNTYSFVAAGQPWLNHEWLFQVTVATLGNLSSTPFNPMFWNVFRAVIVLLFLVYLLFGDLPGKGFFKLTPSPWTIWLGLPLLLGIHNLWPRLILRPELFSYLALVALIRLLEQLGSCNNTTRDNRKILGGIFGLTLVWAQLHGFSGMAPVIVLLALLANVLGPLIGFKTLSRPAWSHLGLALALTLVAQVFTPNGLAGLLYPVKALGQFQNSGPDMKSTINELIPLLKTKAALGRTLMFFKLSLVWGVFWIIINWGRINFLRILIWLITVAAALAMHRSIGLYAIAFMLLHTRQLYNNGGYTWLTRFKFPQGRPVALAGAATSLILATLWGVQVVNDSFYLNEGIVRRFGSGLTPAHYPVSIGNDLSTTGKQKVLTNINAAGYLLSKTSVQVYIDGRTEAYEPKLWSQYITLKSASDKSLQIIRNLNPQTIVLSIGDGAFLNLAKVLVNSSSWQLVGLDEAALAFIPAGAGFKPGDNSQWLQNRIVRLEAELKSKESMAPARLADHYIALARLWKMAGNPQATLRCYKSGLTASPNHPVLLYNFGNLLRQQNNYTSALEHFNQALKGNGQLAKSAINAGECLMNLKRVPEAEIMFKKGVGIDADNFNGWANLGICRMHQA